MAEKQLEITVRPNGEMEIRTENIKGASECTKVVEDILVGVGGADAATEIKKTDDFWDDERKVFTNVSN